MSEQKTIKNPLYTITKEDNYWTIDFSIPLPLFESVKAGIIQRNKEAVKDQNLDKGILTTIVETVYPEIKKELAKDNKFDVDIIEKSYEKNNTSVNASLRLIDLKYPDFARLKEYPNNYEFTDFMDIKLDKNIITRNAIVIATTVEKIKTEAVSKIDKVGRIVKVNIKYLNLQRGADKPSSQEWIVVGANLINNDEFKTFKGAKVGDKFTFNEKLIFFGYNLKNDFYDEKNKVEIEILEITNELVRSSISQLWEVKEIKDTFKSEANLEAFINNMSKFEVMIFNNHYWSTKFYEWAFGVGNFFNIDKAKKEELLLMPRNAFDAMNDPKINAKFSPDLMAIKDKELFANRFLEKFLNPKLINVFVDSIMTSKKQSEIFANEIMENMKPYLKYHSEIVKKDEVAISTLMNIMTVYQFLKITQPSTAELFMKSITSFKLVETQIN